MGWAILKGEGRAPEVSARMCEHSDIYGRAFYPLTLPLTVGRSISVAVTLGAKLDASLRFHVSTILAALSP